MRTSAAAAHHIHGPTFRLGPTTIAGRPGLYLSSGRSIGGGAMVLVGATGAGAKGDGGGATMVRASGAVGAMATVFSAACAAPAPSALSRAATIAPQLSHLSFGSLASPRSSTVSTAGPSAGSRLLGAAGRWFTCAYMTSSTPPSENGIDPVSISYAVFCFEKKNEYTSIRRLPTRSCSIHV